MLVKHVINLCFCSCPGSGEDPPEPPGSGEDLEILEKTWRYWRKPGEDLEILEKTWSFFINLWLTEGKIVSSYTLQTLTSYVFLMLINASETCDIFVFLQLSWIWRRPS